jgi:hypothetical protein
VCQSLPIWRSSKDAKHFLGDIILKVGYYVDTRPLRVIELSLQAKKATIDCEV